MSTLHLACAAAGVEYLPHAAAMLHSVLDVQGGEVDVHFMHGPGLPERRARQLEAMVERRGGSISFLRIDDSVVTGLSAWRGIPTSMYYRIFLPDLLPDVERVLYLDADTIALASLTPLWETDLTGSYIAAVTNVLERHALERPAKLGLAGAGDYINSGVILMNLELMRSDGCAQALHEYLLAHADEEQWGDQDALSVVLAGRRVALHPRWNVMNSVVSFDWAADVLGAAAVDEARADPAIAHFEGPRQCKPWHLLCDHPLRRLYFEHRRETPWPRCRRQGVTPANLVRVAARGLRVRRGQPRRPGQALST